MTFTGIRLSRCTHNPHLILYQNSYTDNIKPLRTYVILSNHHYVRMKLSCLSQSRSDLLCEVFILSQVTDSDFLSNLLKLVRHLNHSRLYYQVNPISIGFPSLYMYLFYNSLVSLMSPFPTTPITILISAITSSSLPNTTPPSRSTSIPTRSSVLSYPSYLGNLFPLHTSSTTYILSRSNVSVCTLYSLFRCIYSRIKILSSKGSKTSERCIMI